MNRGQFHEEVRAVVVDADAAVKTAAKLRKSLRRKRRPGSPYREARLSEMILELQALSKETRRLIGHIQFTDVRADDDDRLRRASKELAQERIQLKRMQR